ncbi:4-hydroxyphenylpyruvate dioxygenase [Roseomonas indoligenes]|uniref:4-hydroxyphenylpyruvate dioxygenase n=1 Tax=Roseomonas indoligenes TaxID=2820811 RepID=A0A940MVG7_9PROT|nr:4-hydroxyphenylpyruvate dioxygenase [Pararoseomonas indoligenes]MBP0494194.1 4-hydroxyphenylpyruvate dioxygenase [Pararoseomonas indoligenes]
MGPFPHDAPRAVITEHNPAGTDGFAFVEYASPEPEKLHALFERMGFKASAKHRTKKSTLYRQGDINYLLTEEPGSHAQGFTKDHGPCVPSMGFRVVDARHAFDHAVKNGAEPATEGKTLDVPAIKGIGGSYLYFIDQYGEGRSCYDAEFMWLGERDPWPVGAGLYYIDHLTHNVFRGRMDYWYDFYNRIFNFRQIRYFDIKGEYTGLFSRALTSPDGRIRIPLNESADEESQIEEYLREYKGEGIQHVACGCDDIYGTIEGLREAGLNFMPSPPETYYEKVDARLPGHGEDIVRLKKNGILVDGEGVVEDRKARLLLQIFSANVIGPVFFEFIERKGDDGFGEGNFRALFESIEEDQVRRGVIGGNKAA